jgi:hypothetical protein
LGLDSLRNFGVELLIDAYDTLEQVSLQHDSSVRRKLPGQGRDATLNASRNVMQ